MAQILILVGTESGNAQMVADALKPVLEGAGHAVDVNDKAASVGDLEAHDVLLVICATHGSGDIPTNILPLAETLERERPDLSGHRYGVIALGDMTYHVAPARSASGWRSTRPASRCPTKKRSPGSRAGRTWSTSSAG